jgi:hypothetical protein
MVAPRENPGSGSRGAAAVEVGLDPADEAREPAVGVVGPVPSFAPAGESTTIGGVASAPSGKNGLRETSGLKVGFSQLASIFGSWGVGGTGVGSGAA